MSKANRRNIAKRMYVAQDSGCFYCGNYMVFIPHKETCQLGYSFDHVWPTSRGGSKSLTNNAVLSCYPCNVEKDNRLPTRSMLVKFKEVYGFRPKLKGLRSAIKPAQSDAEPRVRRKKILPLNKMVREAHERIINNTPQWCAGSAALREKWLQEHAE